eukprot:6099251-Amphidinium_carterae.1
MLEHNHERASRRGNCFMLDLTQFTWTAHTMRLLYQAAYMTSYQVLSLGTNVLSTIICMQQQAADSAGVESNRLHVVHWHSNSGLSVHTVEGLIP